MKKLLKDSAIVVGSILLTATAAQATGFAMGGCDGGWWPSLLRLFGGP